MKQATTQSCFIHKCPYQVKNCMRLKIKIFNHELYKIVEIYIFPINKNKFSALQNIVLLNFKLKLF